MPRLSVIIPNYNRESLIGETLTNILSQTRPPDELIVVDDGSTDGSVDAIAAFGPAVTLLRQANAGPATARNRGFAASSGEVIQFFDSDDLCSLNKLEAQLAALDRSGADFAYSPWLQARLEQGLAIHPGPVLQQRELPPARTPLAWFLRGWVIVFQCCLFRRALLESVGPYREDLMPSEDSELLFRILAAGARPVHVPEAMVLYRLHGGGQISLGGMPAERRARDWARFAAIVGHALDTMADLPAADRRAWRRIEWGAAQGLRQLGLTVDEPGLPRPGAADRAALAGAGVIERIDRRWRGHGWPTAYQADPPTAYQREALATLGYSPSTDDQRS